MNNPEVAYSITDIYNFLSSGSIDIEKSVMELNFLEKLEFNKELLFENTHSIILFVPSPTFDQELPDDSESNIGHFVLLSLLTQNIIEYFDSLAGPIPDLVLKFAEVNQLEIKSMKSPLQGRKSYICAKYCISRMQSLPLSLSKYTDILQNHKTLSPDQIIHSLYKNKK